MTPESSASGGVVRRPSAAAPEGVGFTSQLQAVLQQTKPAEADAAPSRATTGHLHPGGMNDSAHRLLMLNGGTRN